MSKMSKPLFFGSLFLVCATVLGFGQTVTLDSIAPNPSPNFANKVSIDLATFPSQPANPTSGMTLTFPAGANDSSAIFSIDANANNATAGNTAAAASRIPNNDGDQDEENKGGNITGLMTVPTFAGAFAAQGTENTGQVFPFIMVGNHPLRGGTTTIPARITTISLQLLNPDGTLRVAVPFAPFEELTVNSPNFRNADYASGYDIQFGDAVQRAEFFHGMAEDWHTRLQPKVVDRVTLQIPRFVNVQFPDGSIKQVQAYFVGQAPDGSFFVEMLDLLFNALNDNLAVNEINNGNFKTSADNFTMYPNTFLFSINNQGQFASCCVLGFHSFFRQTGVVPQPRWLFTFASWTSPGLFRGGVADVTPLSHEISETFNDPFGNTAVPLWQFPGVAPNARVCQGNLETGDPVEVTANSVFPVTIRVDHKPVVFHPQTEALMQWFEMGATSNAIDGAFSFPNETVLPHSALPCPPATPPAP